MCTVKTANRNLYSSPSESDFNFVVPSQKEFEYNLLNSLTSLPLKCLNDFVVAFYGVVFCWGGTSRFSWGDRSISSHLRMITYVGRKRVDHFNSIGMLWRKYSYILSLLMLNFTNRRSLVSMDEKEWEISRNKFLGEQYLGIKWRATVALQIIVSLSSWCSLNPTLMVMSPFSTCWGRESPGTCNVIP